MGGTVIREDGKVRVEGIVAMEAMATNEKTPNTTMAAFALALQAAGEDLTYEYLMGVSGSAFRFQLAEDWCVTSTISHCGYETETNMFAAIPYEVTCLNVEEDDVEGVQRARRAVAASIDKGIPAVYRIMEDGLIVGYEETNTAFLCVHPQERFTPRGIFVEERWPWCIFVLEEGEAQEGDARHFAQNALQLAVDLFHKDREHDQPLCGPPAWTAWIEEVRDDALCESWDRWLSNWWLYLSLLSARRSAASYLRTVAGEFPDASSDHLLRAAELYGTMTSEVLPDPSAEVAPCALDGNRGYAPEWSKEARLRQADLLKTALELEKKAIAEIEQALAVLS